MWNIDIRAPPYAGIMIALHAMLGRKSLIKVSQKTFRPNTREMITFTLIFHCSQRFLRIFTSVETFLLQTIHKLSVFKMDSGTCCSKQRLCLAIFGGVIIMIIIISTVILSVIFLTRNSSTTSDGK